MMHAVGGVAVAAALLSGTSVWAQNPYARTSTGPAGRNRGGPGVIPDSGGAVRPAFRKRRI
jgi:hypothetical protein